MRRSLLAAALLAAVAVPLVGTQTAAAQSCTYTQIGSFTYGDCSSPDGSRASSTTTQIGSSSYTDWDYSPGYGSGGYQPRQSGSYSCRQIGSYTYCD